MKKRYLVAHDYGMGAVWAVMEANSAKEISLKYPEVDVLEQRPSWMDDTSYSNITGKGIYDVDEEPAGWLAVLVSNRKIE